MWTIGRAMLQCESAMLQSGRGCGVQQELVRARVPPGMSHPPYSPNSPDQTPRIRPTFVQIDQYVRKIGQVQDEYF